MSHWNADPEEMVNRWAVQYSLGWTVMGSLSAARYSGHCSVNFVLVGNKAFLDEAVEEFKVQHLD